MPQPVRYEPHVAAAMRVRTVVASSALVVLAAAWSGAAAQDIRGLEVCTAEKQMERRTGCLQSNVEFLQQTLTRTTRDFQEKLAASDRALAAARTEIAAMKAALAALQRELAEIRKTAKPDAKPAGR